MFRHFEVALKIIFITYYAIFKVLNFAYVIGLKTILKPNKFNNKNSTHTSINVLHHSLALLARGHIVCY